MRKTLRFLTSLTLALLITLYGHLFAVHGADSIEASTASAGSDSNPLLDPDFIRLERAAYFVNQEGKLIDVQPDTYKVEVVEQNLRLTQPKSGTKVLLQAKERQHGSTIDRVVILSIPGPTEDEADVHFLAALFPNGTSLETKGTYSGVMPRGFFDQVGQGLAKAKRDLDKATAPIGQGINKATAPIGQELAKVKYTIEQGARVGSCTVLVGAIWVGKAIAGLPQLLPIAKQRQEAAKQQANSPGSRDQLMNFVAQQITPFTYAIPEMKRVALFMNKPTNRKVLENIFNPQNFCNDSVAAMNQKLVSAGLIPSFAAVRTRGTDEHFYMGYQLTFGGGVGAGFQVGLLGVTDFRGNGGKYWFIGPQGITNAAVGITGEVAFFPKASLETFKGWGGGIGISGGPPSKIISGAIDTFWDQTFDFPHGRGWQGFGLGPGVGVGFIPGDLAFSYTHAWPY